MWIEHIGEIAIGAFIFLFAAHFAVNIYFKMQKRKIDKNKQQNNDQPNS